MRHPFNPPYYKEDLAQLDGLYDLLGTGKTWRESDARAEIELVSREDIGATKRPNVRTPIRIRVVETGDIYDSITKCAKAIGGNSGNISAFLRGEVTHHKGYTFERVED